MNWTGLLKGEVRRNHEVTRKLIDMLDPASLGWKPETGSNWMTVAQLLHHLSNACGAGCRAFLTGDWGLPEGMKIEDIPPEEMLPPAEALPAIASVEEAKQLLDEDAALALEMIDRAGEEALAGHRMNAPWDPGKELLLGQWMLRMIQHLEQHKGQLFYYLKLQGKPVSTPDLWGV